jgi:sterol desaturase/sphingolipid hydroxylase (fatty acid hydroxylase superfamily)
MAHTILAAAAGALCWTFLEYVIHRWMGHDRRFRRTPFGLEHVRHHAEGSYFAPTWKKVLAAAAAMALVSGPALAVAGFAGGMAFVAGLIASYGAYEVLHRREHTHAGFGPYGRWARRHHFHHHFMDPRTNHGVTTPLWDVVFGTYRRPTVIKVPPRLGMPWLLDERGEVRAEHAGTFALAARR